MIVPATSNGEGARSSVGTDLKPRVALLRAACLKALARRAGLPEPSEAEIAEMPLDVELTGAWDQWGRRHADSPGGTQASFVETGRRRRVPTRASRLKSFVLRTLRSLWRLLFVPVR